MEFIHGDLFDKATSLDLSESDEETSPAIDTDTTSSTSSSSSSSSSPSSNSGDTSKLSKMMKDTTPVNEFLEGKNCLTGVNFIIKIF